MVRIKACLMLGVIVLYSGCGGPAEQNAELHGRPDLQYDPVAYSLYVKFANGKDLNRADLDLLKLNQWWSCVQLSGEKHDVKVQDVNRKFEFSRGSVKEYGSNIVGHNSFSFLNHQLVAAKEHELYPAYIQTLGAIRVTAKNDIIIEWSGSIKKGLPREATAEGVRSVKDWLHSRFLASAFDPGKRYALSFLFCENISSMRGSNPTLIGACKIGSNDRYFNSEEGGCLEFSSGLVWSERATDDQTYGEFEDINDQSDPNVNSGSAFSYCEQLEESGYSDWRLPSRSELAGISGANANKYLAIDLGTEEDGDYFWSYYTGNRRSVWAVQLNTGEQKYLDRDNSLAGVVCVRKPNDKDGDGVPDSSDHCPNTPLGEPVATEGRNKGCAISATPQTSGDKL